MFLLVLAVLMAFAVGGARAEVGGLKTVSFSDNVRELCDILSLRKVVRISYNGQIRNVEIHAVGKNRNTGNELVRVYQIFGGSNSGNYIGWKLMKVHKIHDLTILATKSKAPRSGYQRNDKHMTEGVYCQI